MMAHRNPISGIVRLHGVPADDPTQHVVLTAEQVRRLRETLSTMQAPILLDYLDRGYACMLTTTIMQRAGLDPQGPAIAQRHVDPNLYEDLV